MGFDVPADAYDRFMGRYSTQLSAPLCDLVGIVPGRRVLDVGCGPGALVAELVQRVGADHVSAIDPSEPFVAAARERFPQVEVLQGSAEALPFDDASFDAALAQLVVHFMSDPVQGVREMRRVTRPGGVLAVSVWDHAGGSGPLSPFWRVVHELEPSARDESGLYGSREGQLDQLLRDAGLRDVRETALSARVEYASFEDWWEPFELGVGPAGAHVAQLDDEKRAALREQCRAAYPEAPFTIEAQAWTATGVVPDLGD
jgi:SAM-dependent methyltransferase